MSIAWSRRDSIRADSVYADNYTGKSIDLKDETPVQIDFTKSEELRVYGALARNLTISSINMDLHPTLWLRQSNANFPPSDVTIIVPQVDIQVIDGQQEYIARTDASRTTFFQFTFEPHADAVGDTTWQIIYWEEKWN